ncbi:hypothetical protein BJV38_002063 [Clostridium beijerinckii]|uniref:hypothetical protein n=1 Tax=Clostridium beijerinckii TaxID=1520 RepID=UPI003D6AC57A|nr:hypothetical protein [Clostridium beijerinckii]NRT45220.1 hypothetical protein [Clostridium beijerinckii]NRZ20783.1 hypothetical protein [Clostridium beijerinckii]
MKKRINIVAAIIKNENKEILCALCSPVMNSPNLLEFPCGKSRITKLQKNLLNLIMLLPFLLICSIFAT